MLKGIDRIEGIGLFLAAGPSPEFGRATLVYGENGRGKSTLSAILRSCAENNATELVSRATLGHQRPRRATLRLDRSGSPVVIDLSDAAWTHQAGEILVFDAEFVARNVYAGAEITADHRARLLDFALGEEAVVARAEHERITASLQAASAAVRQSTFVIDAVRGSIPLAEYRSLKQHPKADQELAQLRARLNASQTIDAVRARPTGTRLETPHFFDMDEFFDVLRKHLPRVADDAESRVRDHIERHREHGFEDWLSQGRSYADGFACPFCASDTSSNALIAAYREHFDAAYQDLKNDAADLRRVVAARLPDTLADSTERELATTRAQLAHWGESVELEPVHLDRDQLKDLVDELRNLLSPLAEKKAASPMEAFGTREEEKRARNLLTEIKSLFSAANTVIVRNKATIERYKESLQAESSVAIRASINRIEASQKRHSKEGAAQVSALDAAIAERDRLTTLKETARQRLDQLMEDTFNTYGASINQLLSDFGTYLSIEDLTITYRGASSKPRTSFGLKVRGHRVSIAGDEGANFGNSLSEGDKRALAFALFIARLQNDPGLANRIVVIDDPMCSLDRNRRATTIRKLKTLAAACRQLVVLAHDIWFLRDLGDSLSTPRSSAIDWRGIKIKPTDGDWSSFSELDISEECRGPYEQNMSTILGFIERPQTAQRELVARSIRPLIEGYLRRRYPLDIPRRTQFGTVLNSIRDAAPGSRLASAKHLLPELRELNDYTIPFMHNEGESAPDMSTINESELRSYCRRAIVIVDG